MPRLNACGCRITEYSTIRKFLGNKHEHTAAASGWARKQKLWISQFAFSSVHTHSLFLHPVLSKSIFFPSCFSTWGWIFFPAWSTGRKCHTVKCQLKLPMQTLLGLGVSWHFFPWVQSVYFAQFKQKLKAQDVMRVAQGSSWVSPVSVLFCCLIAALISSLYHNFREFWGWINQS